MSKEIWSWVHLIVFLIYHVICYTRKKKHLIISFFHFPVYLAKHLQTKSHKFRRKSPTPSENDSHVHSISIPAKTMTDPLWPDPSLWLSSCLFQPFQVFYDFPLFLLSLYPKRRKKRFSWAYKHQTLGIFWMAASFKVLLFVVAWFCPQNWTRARKK